MTEQGPQNTPSGARRRKRFLSPSQKYEIWLGLLRGESTISEAADHAGVDRSTVMKLRLVAKQGALDALAASRPGVRPTGVDPELAEARAEIARLSEALKEMGGGFTASRSARQRQPSADSVRFRRPYPNT